METLKEKIITVETWLPLFPGFYNTLFDFNGENDIINTFNEEYDTDMDYDDFDFDYQDYRNRVAEEFTIKISEYINKVIPCKIKFQEVVSPKEYNFKNDSINIEVEISLNQLIEKLYEKEGDFWQYIKSTYTSCDGFISHYSNNSEVWFEEYLKEGSDNLPHCIGSVLGFLLDYIIGDIDLYSECEQTNYINYTPKVESLLKQGAKNVENIHKGIVENNYSQNDLIYMLSAFVGSNLTPNQIDKVGDILKQLEEIKNC